MIFSKVKREFIQVTEHIGRNKGLFSLSCFLDLLFIALVLPIYTYIMVQKMFPIYDTLSRGFQGLSINSEMTELPDTYTLIAESVKITKLWDELAYWIFVLVISLFLLWIIIEGINFFISTKIVGENNRFLSYYGKFFLFSLFFYGLIILSFVLTIYLSMSNTIMPIPLFTQGIINVILIVLIALILYFGGISLGTIQKRIFPAFTSTFKIGAKKFKWVILFYLASILIFAVLLFLLSICFLLNFMLFVLIFVFIFIPYLSFSRIMFLYYINRIGN
jgi:hypothetical protein